MRRVFHAAGFVIAMTFVPSALVLAEQPLLLTTSPVEVIGSVAQVSADGRMFSVAGETFRLLPDALVTDANGLELTLRDITSGIRVGLVQQGGEVSHVIIYEGQAR